MNTLPLHPAVVHVPLGLALIMPVVLAALVWAIASNRLPAKVWLLGVVLQAIVLGGAGVALLTGKQDEERVEARAGEAQIDAHERAAQVFTAGAAATLLVAGVGLALRNRRQPFVLAGAASALLSVGVLALGVAAGHRGGALVYGGLAGLAAPAEGGEAGAGTAARQEAANEDDDGDDDGDD